MNDQLPNDDQTRTTGDGLEPLAHRVARLMRKSKWGETTADEERQLMALIRQLDNEEGCE
jgi:hypothetical protein